MSGCLSLALLKFGFSDGLRVNRESRPDGDGLLREPCLPRSSISVAVHLSCSRMNLFSRKGLSLKPPAMVFLSAKDRSLYSGL